MQLNGRYIQITSLLHNRRRRRPYTDNWIIHSHLTICHKWWVDGTGALWRVYYALNVNRLTYEWASFISKSIHVGSPNMYLNKFTIDLNRSAGVISALIYRRTWVGCKCWLLDSGWRPIRDNWRVICRLNALWTLFYGINELIVCKLNSSKWCRVCTECNI